MSPVLVQIPSRGRREVCPTRNRMRGAAPTGGGDMLIPTTRESRILLLMYHVRFSNAEPSCGSAMRIRIAGVGSCTDRNGIKAHGLASTAKFSRVSVT